MSAFDLHPLGWPATYRPWTACCNSAVDMTCPACGKTTRQRVGEMGSDAPLVCCECFDAGKETGL
jgi:hypothetical protein